MDYFRYLKEQLEQKKLKNEKRLKAQEERKLLEEEKKLKEKKQVTTKIAKILTFAVQLIIAFFLVTMIVYYIF